MTRLSCVVVCDVATTAAPRMKDPLTAPHTRALETVTAAGHDAPPPTFSRHEVWGIGAKTALTLWERHRIATVDELRVRLFGADPARWRMEAHAAPDDDDAAGGAASSGGGSGGGGGGGGLASLGSLGLNGAVMLTARSPMYEDLLDRMEARRALRFDLLCLAGDAAPRSGRS